MNTNKFHISLYGAAYSSGYVDLTATVVTDHAHHKVRQSFDEKGKSRYIHVDLGRTYTPDQKSSVERLFLYYYPIVIKTAEDWIQEHHFEAKDSIDLRMNAEFQIYRATYEGTV